MEVGNITLAEALAGMGEESTLTGDAKLYGIQMVEKILESQDSIDKEISQTADNWDMERIAVVDKLVLRFAVAEMLHFPNVPMKVCINEAVEIAKKFSTEGSSRFVNGVLDTIAARHSNFKRRKDSDA